MLKLMKLSCTNTKGQRAIRTQLLGTAPSLVLVLAALLPHRTCHTAVAEVRRPQLAAVHRRRTYRTAAAVERHHNPQTAAVEARLAAGAAQEVAGSPGTAEGHMVLVPTVESQTLAAVLQDKTAALGKRFHHPSLVALLQRRDSVQMDSGTC